MLREKGKTKKGGTTAGAFGMVIVKAETVRDSNRADSFLSFSTLMLARQQSQKGCSSSQILCDRLVKYTRETQSWTTWIKRGSEESRSMQLRFRLNGTGIRSILLTRPGTLTSQLRYLSLALLKRTEQIEDGIFVCVCSITAFSYVFGRK